jgi:TolB-like protein/Tfp pilus assembly protein PilF
LTEVFLSYGHDDAATAQLYAQAFEREGLTVWWDTSLRSGQAFDAAIEEALKRAKAVVVLWSKTSVQSRWVRAEATLAEKRGSLVPVMIESCDLPIMFQLTHTADLGHWRGAPEDAVWRALLAEVRRFVKEHAREAELVTVDQAARITVVSNTASAGVEHVPSIAVLPFANISGDKEQEYFSDGLAEEILNALAEIPGLKVIARTSAFAFRGQNTDIRRIAETLGVSNILEGSVRRSGNRIRVTAQLITADDGTRRWSERYDRELTDIFTVQDEISAAISAALKVRLSPPTAEKPRHTPAIPAYEALLKARHFHWKVVAEAMAQAKRFYELAIALDPMYALAHAEYAEYLFGSSTMEGVPLREVAPIIRASAQRALELDPSLVDAHGPLCLVAAAHDYDWREAGRQFSLALPDGRGSPLNHMGCGWGYFLASGQFQEAVEQLQLAVQGDPLHLTYRAMLAVALGSMGRFSEAEEHFLRIRELDPNFILSNLFLANFYASRQMFAEALPLAEKALAQAPSLAAVSGIYAGLLARLGQSERANEVLQTLGSTERYSVAKALACFHSICGEVDLAAAWYEKAIEERDSTVAIYLQSAIGQPLRASRHWPRLAALMNLPVAQKTLVT